MRTIWICLLVMCSTSCRVATSSGRGQAPTSEANALPVGAPIIDDVNTRDDEPLTIETRLSTNTRNKDGTPFWVYPQAVMVVTPSRQRMYFSREAKNLAANGEIVLTKPEIGRYRVYWARIEAVRADRKTAKEGERIQFQARFSGFPDGASVSFKVIKASCPSDEPVCIYGQGRTQVQQGGATFNWVYGQRLNEDAGGEFSAWVEIADSRVDTEEIRILPSPLSDIQGIQQRLTTYGYLDGPHSGALDEATRKALSAFQKENPPCMFGVFANGWAMKECGYLLCGFYGMMTFPREEQGNLGPVTRRVLGCLE